MRLSSSRLAWPSFCAALRRRCDDRDHDEWRDDGERIDGRHQLDLDSCPADPRSRCPAWFGRLREEMRNATPTEMATSDARCATVKMLSTRTLTRTNSIRKRIAPASTRQAPTNATFAPDAPALSPVEWSPGSRTRSVSRSCLFRVPRRHHGRSPERNGLGVSGFSRVDRSAKRHHKIPEPSFDVHNRTDADQQNWQDRHGIEMEASDV